jgi:hypothetical protein
MLHIIYVFSKVHHIRNQNFPQGKGDAMNEVDSIYEIMERIHNANIESENIAENIFRILDNMEQTEKLTIEEAVNG